MPAKFIDFEATKPSCFYHRRTSYFEVFALLIVVFMISLTVMNHKHNKLHVCRAAKADTPSERMYRGEVEAMDGIGFAFERAEVRLDERFVVYANLPECTAFEGQQLKVDIPRVMETFKECITTHINSFRPDVSLILHNWERNTTVCEESLDLSALRFDEFKNPHESKWAVLPRCKEEHTMVTLGVGHEVSAELHLNRTLPNVKFLGADPIIEPNIQLYSQFGRFFPFAVGNASGTDRFRVLPNQNQATREYVYQDVTTIEVVYVLKEIMKLSWIDFFWIDIEGGEMHFLDYFFKGGKFDENGITICQWNAELHPDYVSNGAQKYFEFVERLAADGRYLFLKARTTGRGVFRMFFLNVENPKCVKKYIP